MSAAQRITKHFGGDWKGSFGLFPAPGHSPADRGMSVKDAENGDVLIHSFNGADPLAVKDECRRLGLLPERNAGVDEWCCTGTYEYRDETGAPLYRTKRMERPGKPKRFEAELPDGTKKIGSVRRVLYRLPELLAADRADAVYLVEGERKADKLASWGLTATAVAFGCNGWRKCYAEALAGRTVAILPDNDEPGRGFAERARAAIDAAGGRAHIIELPGLPPAGDIIDWTGSVDALRALVATAASGPAAKQPRGLAFRQGISAAALMAKTFTPIRWIVPGYLVEGMTLLAGAPKQGKSWLALGWLVAVASGDYAMDSILCEQGDALGLMLEDNERRLQRRLRQMRLAETPERLTLLTAWPTLDEHCVEEIEAWVEAVDNPRLIVVDVFARVKGQKGAKETDYDADYRQAAKLQAIASRHSLAIVVIHHTRKMAADDPFDEVSGTRGLTGASDSVLVLKRDPGTQQPIVYGRGRDLEEIETALQFDKETGKWSILGEAWQVADTIERREIQEVLGRSVDPMTPTEVAAAVGKSRPNVAKMLAKMYADGKVEKISTGRYALVTPVTQVPVDAGNVVTSVTGVTSRHTRTRDGMILAPGESGDEPVPGF